MTETITSIERTLTNGKTLKVWWGIQLGSAILYASLDGEIIHEALGYGHIKVKGVERIYVGSNEAKAGVLLTDDDATRIDADQAAIYAAYAKTEEGLIGRRKGLVNDIKDIVAADADDRAAAHDRGDMAGATAPESDEVKAAYAALREFDAKHPEIKNASK